MKYRKSSYWVRLKTKLMNSTRLKNETFIENFNYDSTANGQRLLTRQLFFGLIMISYATFQIKRLIYVKW